MEATSLEQDKERSKVKEAQVRSGPQTANRPHVGWLPLALSAIILGLLSVLFVIARFHQTPSSKVLAAAIFEVISVYASLASLVLAAVAIWFAVHCRREVDRIQQRTLDILLEIRASHRSIAADDSEPER